MPPFLKQPYYATLFASGFRDDFSDEERDEIARLTRELSQRLYGTDDGEVKVVEAAETDKETYARLTAAGEAPVIFVCRTRDLPPIGGDGPTPSNLFFTSGKAERTLKKMDGNTFHRLLSQE